MRSMLVLMALVGVAACGNEADGGGAGAVPAVGAAIEDIAATSAETGDAPITGTREEVEEAWKCRGLIAAATGAKAILQGEVPPEVAEIPASSNTFWTNRAGRIAAPGMTEAEVDALVASSTRMLATREALERELPNIRACREAELGG